MRRKGMRARGNEGYEGKRERGKEEEMSHAR